MYYRLAQEEILKHIMTTDSSVKRAAALGLLESWYAKSASTKRSGFGSRSASVASNIGAKAAKPDIASNSKARCVEDLLHPPQPDKLEFCSHGIHASMRI